MDAESVSPAPTLVVLRTTMWLLTIQGGVKELILSGFVRLYQAMDTADVAGETRPV